MKILTNKGIAVLRFESLKVCISSFLSFSILLSLLSSCSKDSVNENKENNLSVNMRSVSSDIMTNSMLYVFKTNNDFVKRQWGLFRDGDKLTTSMEIGQWGLVLLSCDSDISGDVIVPNGGNRSSSKMWETKDKDASFLSQTPVELRYAFINNVTIAEDLTISRNATLNRNVAKIQIILEEYSGFGGIVTGKNNHAFVELSNVPTTLTWEGKYYPSRDLPTVSTKPIREYFNFVNKSGQMIADTIDFIIPAHRGTDAFNAVHADTTKHKLKFRVSMPLSGTEYYGKDNNPIEIAYVPKINSIVQLKIKFHVKTKLDMKVSVKDWATEVIQNEDFN